ncbi:hypothetical protein [Nocardiopsis lambiniae]|uniref:Uncharacterized protein n=1 Tax=Nocardiopsis lambiniae TaxID=3075539 RepID=A0ABU2M478_9ACTN|nr:hypothetical protein [Nocardiopsis sp. DSM 44743]MDT0326811.1 hypothetical protein [Nocardiopsis sp. DSM 44743]
MRQFTGFFIGGGFGTAFVLANAGPPLPSAAGLILRLLAVGALVAVIASAVILSRRGGDDPVPGTEAAPRFRFGPFYGIVVLLEVVLLLGGIQVLRALGAPMEANVAWIALVVGLHFLPLAWYWRMGQILGVAVYLSTLGAAGLVMAAAGFAEWVPFVSGVLSGVGMLAGILVGMVGMLRASRGKGDGAADGEPVGGTAHS